MTTTKELTEKLVEQLRDVPHITEIVELATPSPEEFVRRNELLIEGFADATGARIDPGKSVREKERTVYRFEDGGRAVTFHASGALSLRTGVESLDDLFGQIPADEELRALVEKAGARLALSGLVDRDDAFGFERLWKLKAAGSDRDGTFSDPVLTRAVGAYRHVVRDLPVLGRASASVEVTGSGQVSALSVSLRRFAGDAGGATLDKVRTRSVEEAATEVAGRLSKALGGREEDVTLDARGFAFGYLSLGRRRSQGLLAPMYVASVSVDGDEKGERSAHMVAVAGTQETYLRLPVGGRPASIRRAA
ncbi:hypothetical protein [Cellulomonas sp. URHD0024]|uniref:hypothetical protein n=1 Tax=Cellulomonas sp. URHD0024 TaxID=1302620 RepID=UPI0004143659|nr:hypothetical protein [Cellulomonas sp. URHD0024]